MLILELSDVPAGDSEAPPSPPHRPGRLLLHHRRPVQVQYITVHYRIVQSITVQYITGWTSMSTPPAPPSTSWCSCPSRWAPSPCRSHNERKITYYHYSHNGKVLNVINVQNIANKYSVLTVCLSEQFPVCS